MVSRPSSTRADSAESQVGVWTIRLSGSSGQGSRRSAPRSTSSRASICPSSSGHSATRNSSSAAVTRIPSSAPTLTLAAVRIGSGSRRSVIGPSMRTARPSRPAARRAMSARYEFRSSRGGTSHAAASTAPTSTDSTVPRMRGQRT